MNCMPQCACAKGTIPCTWCQDVKGAPASAYEVNNCSMCSALQIIDLDLLDKVGSAKGVEELRVQLKQQVGCC